MKTTKLTEAEFKATARPPMQKLAPEAEPPMDFWPYFEAIAEADFEGHDCSEGQVHNAWQTPDGGIQHVLVNSEDRHVCMVLVLDIRAGSVAGHYLLDLNREHGLSKTPQAP